MGYSMAKNFVIITSYKKDPIASVFLKKNKVATVIDVKDFLNEVEIFDEVSSEKSTLSWLFQGKRINNDANTIILSRIIDMDDSLFKEFAKADKEYARAELQAYLGFALQVLPRLNLYLNEGGAENPHPLPYQWRKIKELNSSISIPSYFWGDARFNHLNKGRLVYSDISNFTKWQINNKPEYPSEPLVFCFEKPLGDPIFVLTIGATTLVTPVSGKINTMLEKSLSALAAQFSADFNYFISETLFFVDGESATFGNITPYVIFSPKNALFNEFVYNTIVSEIASYEK